jgi:hypothetical protein
VDRQIELSIKADGRIVAVYDDDMAELLEEGNGCVERASYVEYSAGAGWFAHMWPVCKELGIPHEDLGPYRLREQALQAEREWLRNKL